MIRGLLPDGATHGALFVSTGGTAGFDIDVSPYIKYRMNSNRFIVDGLSNGTYRVRATWLVSISDTSFSGGSTTQSVTIANSDIDDLRLADDSIAFVEGTVSIDGVATVDGTIFLVKIDGDASEEVAAVIAQDGQFIFRNVKPGTYTVRYSRGSPTFLESAAQDSSLSDGKRIILMGGRDPVSLKIALSTNVGTVRGLLRGWDGEGVHGEVLAQSEGSMQFYTSTADANGRFSITGLAPGEYSLYAWHSLSEIEYANPSVLRKY